MGLEGVSFDCTQRIILNSKPLADARLERKFNDIPAHLNRGVISSGIKKCDGVLNAFVRESLKVLTIWHHTPSEASNSRRLRCPGTLTDRSSMISSARS